MSHPSYYVMADETWLSKRTLTLSFLSLFWAAVTLRAHSGLTRLLTQALNPWCWAMVLLISHPLREKGVSPWTTSAALVDCQAQPNGPIFQYETIFPHIIKITKLRGTIYIYLLSSPPNHCSSFMTIFY